MFDDVTRQDRGRRAVRSSAFVAASAVLQALCIAAIIFVGDQLRAAATGTAPLVPVKFIKGPHSLDPSPLPAAPPPPGGRRRHLPPRSRVELPARSPPPTALIQPKTAPEQPSPVSAEPPTESPELPVASDGDSAKEGAGGVEGGIAGGTPGGVIGGQQGGGGTGDGPILPGAGARKPAAAARDCVQKTIRMPRDLLDFLSGPVVVEFAIRQDGAPTHFTMVTPVADSRIADAIWQAISNCKWIAGTDEHGRPAWFRVRMPLRFKGG